MTGNELFLQLVQRLCDYTDASVLWICLKEHADERDFSTSAASMTFDQLCDTVKRSNVQRSIQRLQETGFITVRTMRGWKTTVKVNRDAVLELLRQPMPERLPANSQKVFPFLDAWAEDLEAVATLGKTSDAVSDGKYLTLQQASDVASAGGV